MQNEETIRENVRQVYGKLADETSAGKDCGNIKSCCGAAAKPDLEYASELGYSKEDCANVPLGANLSLGCGNPIAIASLKIGETVLDLGSGAGFDCFLAAKKVGHTGHVIGVDMTPSMVSKARLNMEKGGYKNVEFRLGEIENLPVADKTVDVIISNCVINLSLNKAQVFQEMSRVLKPGGRIAIHDTITNSSLPESIKNNLDLYSACVAGAITRDEITQLLEKVGFDKIEINVNEVSRSFIGKWVPGSEAENYIAAATIQAILKQ